MTIDECTREQLFCSLFKGLSYMTKKYNVSPPSVIWSEALNFLKELESKDRKDIVVRDRYGCHESPEAMTILAVIFYMVIAKENEGHLVRSDLKDEIADMLRGYGDKWHELYGQLRNSELDEEKKNRYVVEFDYHLQVDELSADEEQIKWDRLIKAGWLNEDKKPIRGTLAEQALLANTIAEELHIYAKWKYFKKLWGENDDTFRKAHDDFKNSDKAKKLKHKFLNIMRGESS